jgi:hypothetical protein
MIHRIVVVPLLCLLILASSLSALSTIHVNHDVSRNKLAAALASPSGKLTLSPELVIPEPRDATSILLLSNAVQTLSQGIRLGKANAAFVHGSIDALQTFTNEQATALGNFPGPVPVVYCDTVQNHALAEDGSINFAAIAEAGADGILIPVPYTDHWNFDTLASTDEPTTATTTTTSLWTTQCQLALQAGLQPVPEISIRRDIATAWSESDVEALTSRVIEALDMVPVAMVLTIQPSSNADLDETDEVPDNDNQAPVLPLPRIAKATRLRVPILGSVRQSAGENRLSDETLRYKEAGFAGTVLRSECVPIGLRRQPNLEMVAKFWQACLTDLKSTRSKSFGFRSKNNLNVSVATKWGNYQKSVIESGALGDPQETASLNEAAGDYQGF